ncbi:RNA polymerase sigma factor [Kitasatospora indigofera]|uniref:RNA polymerase sigma factor n=1 Tax=Kitasatospora indigofera TaxID=67307 RepID=UPI00363E425E
MNPAAGAAAPAGPRAAGRPTDGPADLSAALTAARGGDEDAFRQLFRAVQPGLLRYLRVLVGGRPGDTQDAEDIASETWLQIARDLHTFSGDTDGFRGWAATVARNRALDHLRSRRRRPTADLPLEYLAELASGDDTAGAALATVGTSDALALISRLPRDQAEAVLLRVVMQLDAESAARVLGKRAGTVRMAAHRGLRGLAKLLERTGAPEAGFPHRGAPQKKSPQGVTEPRTATLKDLR